MNNKFRAILLFLLTWIIILPPSFAQELSIKLQGIPNNIQNNIKQRLQLSKNLFVEDIYQNNPDLLHQQVKHHILEAIKPYGYFSPAVQLTITQQSKKLFIHAHIDLGLPITIRNLSISITGHGQHESTLNTLKTNPPLKVGQQLRAEDYKKTKEQLIQWAQDHGYIRAYFEYASIQIHTQNHSCDIVIVFDTGDRFLFGPIDINQNFLTEQLVASFIQFKTGEPYTTEPIVETQSLLSNTGYFSHVNIRPAATPSATNEIPVHITLKPRRLFGINLGAGFSSDTRLESTLAVDWRRVNRAGHKFNSDIQLSRNTNAIHFNYNIPGRNPTTDAYSISGNWSSIHITAGHSSNQQWSFQYITNWHHWTRRLVFNILSERYRLRASNQSQHSLLLIPQINMFKRHTDHHLSPQQGYRLDLNLQGSLKKLLSDTSFLQGTVFFGWLKTFQSFRIIQKNKLGAVWTKAIQNIPLSLQFLAGGPGSLRGYSYQAIGPGRYQLIHSLDLQYALNENWWLGGFVDLGNVFKRLSTPIKTNIGLSLIRKTPIGPITISLARGLQQDAPSFRIILMLGPEI